MSTITERYAAKYAGSQKWAQEGDSLFAGGVTHQAQFTKPFPVYYTHADGPFKYDVDDNEIIDYVMGSGSLIMGHNPPEVVEAVKAQATRGTHLGGTTAQAVRWAQLVKELMPSIERIRFTNSGTESTYLAVRLACAFTGKNKILKFRGQFHGWHDYVLPESGQSSGGVPQAVLDTVVVAPVDTGEVDRILGEDRDIAAVIVEANGANGGVFPLQNPGFLQDLRKITTRHGVLMILDEVITGFRLSRGGAQERWGIEPDLTTMAKIMAGGYVGGGVGGRADIMDLMSFRNDPEWDGVRRVAQAGTFNAQPATAAAGIAALETIIAKDINAMADASAKRLKDGINELLIKNEVTGHAHGISSIVQLNLGADCGCDRELCTMPYDEINRTMTEEKRDPLRRAMLVHGVDMPFGRKFYVSAAHADDVVDQALEAFDKSLKDLRAERIV